MASRKTRITLVTLFALLLAMLLPAGANAANPSNLVSRVTTSRKVMALTFDFGSDAGNVSRILQVLADRGVKSTFFATGEAAANYPGDVRSVVAQGHEIGNHSYSHPYFTKLTSAQMADELSRAATAIRNATGQAPKSFFRPPYGDYNAAVLAAVGNAGYPNTIMWTIDTVDWQGVSSSTIRDKVLSKASPGSIVLMHVGGGATGTPDALPGMIDGLRAAGYELVTISELLGAKPTGQTLYVVKPGDTMYKIANLYGVTVQAIVSANNLTNPNLIYPNQVLVIPASSPPPTSTVTYTVQPGDTLYRIAAKFGTTVTAIADANKIADPNLIYPGQVLTIPGTSSGNPPSPTQVKYTVQPGDTLYRIAAKFGTTVAAVAAANNIANPNLIYPGQVLVIPR